MTTQSPMVQLRQRLQDAGINRRYLKQNILPDWWDDKIAANPAGLAQAHGYLFTRAGVDLKSLKDPSAPIRFVHRSAKFKKNQTVPENELTIAKSLALSVAAVVARGVRVPYQGLKAPIAQIRETITQDGNNTVNLETLLAYCWGVGIPVVHLGSFPSGAKKMEGMTAMIKGRPVIVLSKNLKSPAWQVFILAHELGHIYSGHLDAVEVLVDYSFKEGGDDVEEDQANLFALELLTGSPATEFRTLKQMTAPKLASQAKSVGNKMGIEPGVIVLNYAKNMDAWPLANAALKHVESTDSAINKVHEKMFSELDIEDIGEENHDWLMTITGAGQHA